RGRRAVRLRLDHPPRGEHRAPEGHRRARRPVRQVRADARRERRHDLPPGHSPAPAALASPLSLADVLALLLRLLIFGCGVYIVLQTVGGAVRTFVLPRDEVVKLTSLVFRGMRWLFGLALRRAHSYGERDAIMALYAPLALLALPVVWLTLVAFGYT